MRSGRQGSAITMEHVRRRLHSLPRRFRPESADGLVAEWELRVGGDAFTITVRDHSCTVADGSGRAPQVVISTDPETWLAVDDGKLPGGKAFVERRLDVSGNLDLAVRLQTLFRPHRRARRPSDLDQVDVVADGLKLSCYVLGEGRPIVFLHGLGGSKVTWLPLLWRLGGSHRLIVPDLPGHGESDKPRADYTPRFYARVIRRLMDRLDAPRAVLVGNSLGGRVAIEMALAMRQRVESVALLAPSVPGFRWRHLVSVARLLPTEIGAVPLPLRERWMRPAIRRLFGDPGMLPPEGYAAVAGEFTRIYSSARARMAFFSSLRHIVTEPPGPFFDSLRRMKPPALLVTGDRDRLVPGRLGVMLSAALPRARVVVLPGVGHVPHYEALEETLEALEGFLKDPP